MITEAKVVCVTPPQLTLAGGCHGVLEETLPLGGRAIQDDGRGPKPKPSEEGDVYKGG